MLTVTGTAQFENEGKTLVIETRVQPHWPREHEQLERAVAETDHPDFAMEQGCLVMKTKVPVPAAMIAAEEAEESASFSGLTIVRDGLPTGADLDAVSDEEHIAHPENDRPSGRKRR
jgi:hypothetical protein